MRGAILAEKALPSLVRSERVRRLGVEATWVFAGQALAAVAGLAGVRLLTHALDPVAYGELALAMTLVAVAQQVVVSPLSMGLLRFFSLSHERGTFPAYRRAAARLLGRATLVLVGLAAVAALAAAAAGAVEWVILIALSLGYALLGGYTSALENMQTAARERRIVAAHQGLGQWLRYLLAAGMLAFLGSSARIALAGFCVAAGIILVSQAVCFSRTAGKASGAAGAADTSRTSAEIWAYAAPFAAWGVFTWAYSVSDRWALELFVSRRDVGVYAALYQLGYYPVIFACDTMIRFLAPVLYSMAGQGDGENVGRIRRLGRLIVAAGFVVTALLVALATLLHRSVFTLLVAEEYRYVSFLLPQIVLAAGLFACGQAAMLQLLSGRATGALLMPKITTAVAGIALNVAGAYYSGVTGVVFAALLFGSFYCGWALWLAHGRHHDG